MAIPRFTLVVAEGCALCEDALDGLSEIRMEFPHELEVIEAASDAGRALVAKSRPGMMPLLLIDGCEFSTGRVPRKKLRRHLERVES
ncbi:MAG: glutaredoxin [Actinomycetota bacterium]